MAHVIQIGSVRMSRFGKELSFSSPDRVDDECPPRRWSYLRRIDEKTNIISSVSVSLPSYRFLKGHIFRFLLASLSISKEDCQERRGAARRLHREDIDAMYHTLAKSYDHCQLLKIFFARSYMIIYQFRETFIRNLFLKKIF